MFGLHAQPTASKDTETVKHCHAFSQKIKAWGDLCLDSAGESFLHTSWAADGKKSWGFLREMGVGGVGGVLGYFDSYYIKIIHSVSLKTESGV